MRLTLALERRLLARSEEPRSTLAEIDWHTGRALMHDRPQAWQPQGLIPRASICAAQWAMAGAMLIARPLDVVR